MKWILFSVLTVCSFASLSVRAVAYDLEEMVELLEFGSWGWVEGEGTCELNPKTFKFDPARSEFTTSWAHTHEPATYRIIYSETNVITAFILGEDRRTETGDLVIWQLWLKKPNVYYWRRLDWPARGKTDDNVLCDGAS